MAFDLKDSLINGYTGSNWFIHRLADGLTQAESMRQPFPGVNCLNWVLGHIITRRNTALEVLGITSTWSQEVSNLYRSGSLPLEEQSEALRLDDLLGALDQTEALICGALQAMPATELETEVENDLGCKPRWGHLDGLLWHETIHVGHLDLLRALILSTR